jgi:hypothetical protein
LDIVSFFRFPQFLAAGDPPYSEIWHTGLNLQLYAPL